MAGAGGPMSDVWGPGRGWWPGQLGAMHHGYWSQGDTLPHRHIDTHE